MPHSPIGLTTRGAETRLSQDFSLGRINRRQFLLGVGALSKQVVAGGQSSVTLSSLGLPDPFKPHPTKPTRSSRVNPVTEPVAGGPGFNPNRKPTRSSRVSPVVGPVATTGTRAKQNALDPFSSFRDAFLRRPQRFRAQALSARRI